VRENDVFPEEFLNFLSLPGPARAALLEQHAIYFTRISGAACNGSFEKPRLRNYFHIGRNDG
jgi:isocitrate dehydrogenase kinase/phosphatase